MKMRGRLFKPPPHFLIINSALFFADIFGMETRHFFGVNRNLLQRARALVGAYRAVENFAYNLFTVFLSHNPILRSRDFFILNRNFYFAPIYGLK